MQYVESNRVLHSMYVSPFSDAIIPFLARSLSGICWLCVYMYVCMYEVMCTSGKLELAELWDWDNENFVCEWFLCVCMYVSPFSDVIIPCLARSLSGICCFLESFVCEWFLCVYVYVSPFSYAVLPCLARSLSGICWLCVNSCVWAIFVCVCVRLAFLWRDHSLLGPLTEWNLLIVCKFWCVSDFCVCLFTHVGYHRWQLGSNSHTYLHTYIHIKHAHVQKHTYAYQLPFQLLHVFTHVRYQRWKLRGIVD